MPNQKAAQEAILVVGAGMSGLTAAIEAAEVGKEVYIVEKEPFLGGRVAQMNQYFPKLCSPDCGLEINYRRIKANPRIHILTMAQVSKIDGKDGDYNVSIKVMPRYVNERCTACGECANACTVEIDNKFNFGLNKIKAAYLPHAFAFPLRYIIDPLLINTENAKEVEKACKYKAIELDMKEKEISINVGAVIWATGWSPYDASKIMFYGAGSHENVLTNIQFERFASNSGHTRGKIIKPSDGGVVNSVAFVQCAGSRDENHLPYCSRVCCLATLKQAMYVREQYPNAEISIFYIDIRALGRFEDFYNKVKQDDKIRFIKGKVAKIEEDKATKELTLRVEDQETQRIINKKADLVVLATGMVPNTATDKIPADIQYDENGFVINDPLKTGIYGAGCIKKPADVAVSVQDATNAAMKAIQSTARR